MNISQSDVNKYISDFENDKRYFTMMEWYVLLTLKNQNIKSEEDNMWKGIQRGNIGTMRKKTADWYAKLQGL